RLLRRAGATITFVRNPRFREWSHAAQPAGNPAAIVWRTYPSIDAALQAVEQGRADWIFGILPPRELPRLRVDVPAQLHDNASFIVDFIPLNTHVAPFDDVRVRRALNLAIDRQRIVTLYGGPSAATPICQPLPAGFLGYHRICPYTARPAHDGVWRAPDLARARRLVRASGTRGDQIDVWGTSDNLGVPHGLPAYVASVLRSLGYRTRLRIRAGPHISYALRRTFQLSVDGDWAPDYPGPSAFLPPFFGCGGNYTNGYVCDAGLDDTMRRASAAELRAPDAAAGLWEKADRTIVDRAYWVPTVSSHAPELVSRRVGNYEVSPIWDFVADQAWLR
ncbi:MAG TPA: ABC transporter substrate-binding protein, partial [Solirubrobacteraceae bacterium]|nr:ABC transporter substrate-binding protein [Solirubrobacteraceae bacterium]